MKNVALLIQNANVYSSGELKGESADVVVLGENIASIVKPSNAAAMDQLEQSLKYVEF
jgi:hypothetical protein